jgi:hypothetical protein
MSGMDLPGTDVIGAGRPAVGGVGTQVVAAPLALVVLATLALSIFRFRHLRGLRRRMVSTQTTRVVAGTAFGRAAVARSGNAASKRGIIRDVLLAPPTAVGCRLAMSSAMAYMFITVIWPSRDLQHSMKSQGIS